MNSSAVQALINLPRGPKETTQSYYAGSRLGVYVCTVLLWGAGVGKPRVHYFMGRCKEKSPPYSMAIFRRRMEEFLDFKGVKDLCWWSDGGKHFRASVPIATMTTRALEQICRVSDVNRQHTCDLNY